MPSKSFKTLAATDNRIWATGGAGFQSLVALGEFGTTSDHCFVRFPGITISPSDNITSAVITFTSNGVSDANDCNVRIYGHNTGDSTAPVSGVAAEALSLTAAFTDWAAISTWTPTLTKFSSPDITAVVQELVNCADYAYSHGAGTVAENVTLTVVYAGDASGGGSLTLPAYTISANDQSGFAARLTFPSLVLSSTAALQSTGVLNENLPALTMGGGVGQHGAVALTFPKLSISIGVGIWGSVELTNATLSSQAIHAFPGNLASTMPSLTCDADSLVGELGEGDLDLPPMALSSTGFDIPVGILASSLPAFIVRGVAQSSDRFESDVLRYTRP
jgi:hypothetical protein